jgi:hypothetical protein
MNKITRDETEHGVEYVRADEAQAEVLEQCRINGMSAEREDALRAELTRLKANIALDKMAENARELGLDYEPAAQKGRDWSLLEATQESLREHMAEIKRLKAAQPAPVQEPVAWMYESVCGNDFAIRHDPPDYAKNIRPLYTTPPTPQPVPVKTYHDGKPWPVAPKPWVGLSEEERRHLRKCNQQHDAFARAIEIKLKELNHE